MVEEQDFAEWSDRLAKLHREAARILDGLDELGLYQAGGHLSMAMDAMLQAQRDRMRSG